MCMYLQKEMLKAIEKMEKKNNNVTDLFLFEGVSDFYDAGISDGHFIKFINKKHFYIDLVNYPFKTFGAHNSKYYKDGAANSDRLTLTNETRLICDGKKTVRALETENGDRVWYDVKFEKFFTDYFSFDKYTFRGAKKDIIYIFNNYDLCGVIMPVKIND